MFFYNLMQSRSFDVSTVLVAALGFFIAVIFSVVIHEISHGYAALYNGDRTAKMSGRLTLNPVAHFNLIGVLMFLLIGFGWARPVPIDPRNFRNYKKGMIMVSLAGVASNLLLGGIGLLLLYLFAPLLTAPTSSSVVYVLTELLFFLIIYGIQINFMLSMFNLLPVYPLDGYRLIASVVPNSQKFQMFMVKNGIYILLGLILLGKVGDMFGIPYLDIFGMFSNLIAKLIAKVAGLA